MDLRLVLALLCISVLDGCETGTTGTKKEMNVSALSKFDQLEVQVSVDKDFSVVLAGQKVNGIDYLLLSVALAGGIAGTAVASGVDSINVNSKAAVDARRAKDLREAISEINPQESVQKALVDGLQSTARFKSVTAASVGAGSSADKGTFRVRIENWGLNSDKSEKRSLQQVQVGLNATAWLIGGDGKIVWERKDYFTGGTQHSFAQYRDSPELLKSEINEMIQRYCTRMVNEIRYAR
jgi:hypothetical protein